MLFRKQKVVLPEDFARAIPLRNLPKRILCYVASLAKLEYVSGCTTLFDIDQRTKNVFYLIKGQVTLRSAEGETDTVNAGSPRARFPLNIELPCKHSAKTLGRAILVKIPREIMQNIERLGSDFSVSNESTIELVEDEMKDEYYVNFFPDYPQHSAIDPACY